MEFSIKGNHTARVGENPQRIYSIKSSNTLKYFYANTGKG